MKLPTIESALLSILKVLWHINTSLLYDKQMSYHTYCKTTAFLTSILIFHDMTQAGH